MLNTLQADAASQIGLTVCSMGNLANLAFQFAETLISGGLSNSLQRMSRYPVRIYHN